MNMIKVRKVFWSLIAIVSGIVIMEGVKCNALFEKLTLLSFGVVVLCLAGIGIGNAIMDDWFDGWS